MYGVLETSLGELTIVVVGVGDLIEVVTGLNVLTHSEVETTELELLDDAIFRFGRRLYFIHNDKNKKIQTPKYKYDYYNHLQEK